MNSELRARLILFEIIEGGTQFWSDQISHHGVEEVVARLENRFFDPVKFQKLYERYTYANPERTLEKIESCGARLLTPDDEDWPLSLSDLSSPPIALGFLLRFLLTRYLSSPQIRKHFIILAFHHRHPLILLRSLFNVN